MSRKDDVIVGVMWSGLPDKSLPAGHVIESLPADRVIDALIESIERGEQQREYDRMVEEHRKMLREQIDKCIDED